MNFRSGVSNLVEGLTPYTTAYSDPNGGFSLQAKCYNNLANPDMDARILGSEDDGILTGTLFDEGIGQDFGPPINDADIDNGDAFNFGGDLSDNQVRHVLFAYGDSDNTSTAVQAVLRTKTSTGSTPTQGSCAFVGTASVSG